MSERACLKTIEFVLCMCVIVPNLPPRSSIVTAVFNIFYEYVCIYTHVVESVFVFASLGLTRHTHSSFSCSYCSLRW